jgi:hypothetical protein
MFIALFLHVRKPNMSGTLIREQVVSMKPSFGRLTGRALSASLRNVAMAAAGAVLLLGTTAAGGSLTRSAQAAELLMLEQAGCAWCRKWEAEIGPVYGNTEQAKIAPIRKVDINAEWPEDLANVRKERFTPTFVLIEDGIEIARMRGYTGDEFFWFLLDEMLQKLPAKPGVEG